MIPLDPPFSESATVGGILAANTSGPRRRLYGTARDLVIGMKFATLEGKLVQSGGMVVKNVAGLDMGKLMIGSFGTLAAIAVVNFKAAADARRWSACSCCRSTRWTQAIAARDRILNGVLQPAAIDLLNPLAAGAARLQRTSLLAVQAGGNAAVIERYAARSCRAERRHAARRRRTETRFWRHVEEFTPRYLEKFARARWCGLPARWPG